jgi:hypothetical protein
MNAPVHASTEDARIAAEASRQIGRPVAVRKTDIALIRAADTVFHQGIARTVCPGDLRHDGFMGRTLFGDSYVLGRRPVMRLVM